MGEADEPQPGELPAEFAELVASVIAPGEAESAAAALEQALRLDDPALGVFLEMLAERVRMSSDPVTAGELLSLVQSAGHAAATQSPPA